ncbi:MAG: VanZ family protein [Candidatus Bipolaricaulia bacterium]
MSLPGSTVKSVKRYIWTVIFILYSGAIFYGSIYPVNRGAGLTIIPHIDKLIHAGEFFLFVLIGYRTTSYYPKHNRRREIIIAAAFFFGGLTELTQIFLSYRSASVIDLLVDFLGAGLGLSLLLMVEKRLSTKEGSGHNPTS